MSIKIFTHGDVDGVASAALISMYIKKDYEIIFTHPHGLLKDLKEFSSVGDTLYILDIALDEVSWPDTIKLLQKYGERNKVMYFDHHPTPLRFMKTKLKNIAFIHEAGRSTSELVHEYYRDKLPIEAGRIALYGAIGDYSDETPYMRRLYSYWDKRMIYFESGILSQGLEASRRMYDFKRSIIEKLVSGYLPSDITELIERAIEMSRREEEMRKRLKNKIHILNNLAYVIDPEGSLGRAATYLIGLSGRSVGIAIERRGDIAIMSLRARRGDVDLNIILRKIAPELNGSGGGHPFASGCRVPFNRLDEFLRKLDSEIGRYIQATRYPLHISP